MSLTVFNKKPNVISNPEPGGCEIVDIYYDPALKKVVVKKKSEPVK